MLVLLNPNAHAAPIPTLSLPYCVYRLLQVVGSVSQTDNSSAWLAIVAAFHAAGKAELVDRTTAYIAAISS